MRVGAANPLGGGGSFADSDVCPGRRKRGGVAGLPCSEGCSSSLPGFAAGGGVWAAAGRIDQPIIAATIKPAAIGTRQWRPPGELRAPKARTSAAVRVTSEAAKQTTVKEPKAARGRSRGQPRETGTD